MSNWTNIYIPIKNIKKQNEQFYRIYMPEDTTGAGYFFLHPAKLIRRTRHKNIYSLGYNDKFKFTLYYEENGQLIKAKQTPLTPIHIGQIYADYHRIGVEKLARCS